LLQKCVSRFGSYTRNARHIIGTVPHERQLIDYQFRIDPKLFFYFLPAISLRFLRCLFWIVNHDIVRNQLEEILVTCHAPDFKSLFLASSCHCADNIIRLVTGHLKCRDIERLYGFADTRELINQFVRHFCACGLVLGIHFMSKSRMPGIEHHCKVIRFFLLHDLEQRVNESECRRSILPFGIDHRISDECKKSAID